MPADVRTMMRGGLAAALWLCAATSAAAQDPVPRDTLPRDTVRVEIPEEAIRADTLPDKPPSRDSIPDSARVAPSFPEFPHVGPAGFAPGVWEWRAAELSRWHGLSLEDFFDRIPGLLTTRAGSFGRHAGASPYGGGGGRVRIYLDGWELRAMNGGTPDLQRVPLADVVALRVERRLGEVRVDVSTFRLADRRPYAQIEGADGDFDSRILRPFFAAPLGSRMVLQLGLDLVETDGFRRAEPFAGNTPFARLSYLIAPELGVQLDYRSSAWSMEPARFVGSTIPGEDLDRSELVLRGRGRLGRLWLDAAVGRSEQSAAPRDTLVPDLRSRQGYLRAAADLGPAALVGTARVHLGDDQGWAPDERELGLAAYLTPRQGFSAGADLRHRTRAGEGGLELEGWARAALPGGLALFGSMARGDRPVTFLRDSIRVVGTIGGIGGLPGVPAEDTLDVVLFRTAVPTLSALRAGGEWRRGRAALSAAYVVHDVDRLAPYGTYHDAGFEPFGGSTVSALEGQATVPLFLDGLRVEGWFLNRLDDERRPYLPRYMGRAALEYHDLLRGGNLEPTLRLEIVGRGRAPLPSADPEQAPEATRYALLNAFVQVRILDIRIFWRMENLFDTRSALDVAGTRLPGARQLFGVRWFFRN